MRTLDESIAAAELWVELTHEKNAGAARDFLTSAAAAGKKALLDPVISRGNMLRNADNFGKSDHHRRLAVAGGGALLGGGVAGHSTWSAHKKRQDGQSASQLENSISQEAEKARAAAEGRPANLKALEKAKKLSDWAAEHPRAATAIAATGGALTGGAVSLPWYQKYVMPHVKP